MTAKIQAVFLPYECEAVGCGIARILQVVLTKVLVRFHIKRTLGHVENSLQRIVEQLTSGMGGQKLVPFGKLEIADERILEFPYDGMGLVIGEFGSKSEAVAFRGDCQAQVDVHSLSPAS